MSGQCVASYSKRSPRSPKSPSSYTFTQTVAAQAADTQGTLAVHPQSACRTDTSSLAAVYRDDSEWQMDRANRVGSDQTCCDIKQSTSITEDAKSLIGAYHLCNTRRAIEVFSDAIGIGAQSHGRQIPDGSRRMASQLKHHQASCGRIYLRVTPQVIGCGIVQPAWLTELLRQFQRDLTNARNLNDT